jgi:ribonuclease-3
MPLSKLQTVTGHKFKNTAVLREAITHPSIAHEKGATVVHNQRLEFLGDAVLQLVLTDRVYQLYPGQPEGDLTQLRAHLANRHALFRRAMAINLGEFLLLGKGEESSGGRTRLSNLADAFEALIGAIYLDGGIRAARKFILKQFTDEFGNLKAASPRQNPKGRLQELLQTHATASPQYRVVHETGPDHDKRFEAVVEWRGQPVGRGHGSSKQLAEVAAATDALQALEDGKLDGVLPVNASTPRKLPASAG